MFTINNPTPTDRRLLMKLEKSAKYIVYGNEVAPSTGTPHIQGYCEFGSQISRSQLVKKYLPRGGHLQARRGTSLQASEYCKKGGNYVESGTLSKSGRRTDIESYTTAVLSGQSFLQLAESHPLLNARYYRYADRLRLHTRAALPRKFEKVEVIVLCGEAGLGKTRRAGEIDPYLWEWNDKRWFDGYDGQETMLIDDFDGSDIPYKYLLRLLDGYQFLLPIKGGFTWKEWRRVIITTSHHPRQWYGKYPQELKRRISRIEIFKTCSEVGAVITPNL